MHYLSACVPLGSCALPYSLLGSWSPSHGLLSSCFSCPSFHFLPGSALFYSWFNSSSAPFLWSAPSRFVRSHILLCSSVVLGSVSGLGFSTPLFPWYALLGARVLLRSVYPLGPACSLLPFLRSILLSSVPWTLPKQTLFLHFCSTNRTGEPPRTALFAWR